MCVDGDRDTQSVNTLQRALRAGKNHIADMLLSHGAYADNVTVDGTTPLHDAVIKVRIPPCIMCISAAYGRGDAQEMEGVVDHILQRSNHVLPHADKEGWTPLHCAAIVGNAPIIRRLLDEGAIPDCLRYPFLSQSAIAFSC